MSESLLVSQSDTSLEINCDWIKLKFAVFSFYKLTESQKHSQNVHAILQQTEW